MARIVAVIIISAIALATCSAYILPEEPDDNLDKAVEAATKRIANEAIQTGFILREVAEELSKKFGETDEYFFGDLWNQAKAAVKEAGNKIKQAAEDAVENIKSKAKDEALKVLGKILDKVGSGYAAEDSATKIDSVQALCKKIAEVGERLIDEGRRLGGQ
ncbi:hypothetical protein V5799_023364 [Amblyomma americanum]|uniref:Secreted protein n=1 Tax=Amblyomma americanum TaxID=6943 RepID=A0AAQ4FI01_AMBAM